MKSKILFLLFLLLSTLSYNYLHAQCPKGKVNCEGECGRFIDEDGDGYCDVPLVGKEKPTKKREKQLTKHGNPNLKSNSQKIDPKKTDPKKQEIDTSIQKSDIDSVSEEMFIDGEDTIVEAVVVAIEKTDKLNPKRSREIQDEEEAIESFENIKTPKPYRLVGITSITLLAYFLTLMLVRAGRMKKLTHRKFWNTILLITFLVSCILGFLLVVQLNYQFEFLKPLYLSSLKLHVEFGIAMTLVAIIHIFWHIKYFKKLIRTKQTPTTTSTNE